MAELTARSDGVIYRFDAEVERKVF